MPLPYGQLLAPACSLHLTPWSFEASVRRALYWTRSEDQCSRKDPLLVLLSGDPSRCLETAAPGPGEPSPGGRPLHVRGAAWGVRATSSRPALCTPLPVGFRGSRAVPVQLPSSETVPYPMVSARCAPGLSSTCFHCASSVPNSGSHGFCPCPASSRAPPPSTHCVCPACCSPPRAPVPRSRHREGPPPPLY